MNISKKKCLIINISFEQLRDWNEMASETTKKITSHTFLINLQTIVRK